MADLRRTEVDGLYATWWVIRPHRIAIAAVENTSDTCSVLRFGPGNYPDLAQARELHPELARLWDAVRHAFWGELIPPRRPVTECRVWA